MSNFKFKTPQESVGLQFWKLHTQWQKKITAELSQYKITHTQFVIMASIMWFQEQSIEPSQAEISKATGIDKMTLSKAIVRLEALLFVKRVKNKQDTRSISVSLKDKGLLLMPTLVGIVEDIDTNFFDTKRASDIVLFSNVIIELLKKDEEKHL